MRLCGGVELLGDDGALGGLGAADDNVGRAQRLVIHQRRQCIGVGLVVLHHHTRLERQELAVVVHAKEPPDEALLCVRASEWREGGRGRRRHECERGSEDEGRAEGSSE